VCGSLIFLYQALRTVKEPLDTIDFERVSSALKCNDFGVSGGGVLEKHD
jgi:hypothetical protein